MDLTAAETGLRDMIKERTGFQCGYADLPTLETGEILETPFFVLNPIIGGLSDGGLAGFYEMTTDLIQIDTIGITPEQVRQAHDRMHNALDQYWADIPGAMGPPQVSVGGIVRTDDRRFVINDNIYLEVTGT